MPHDIGGNLLKEGDEVLIPCKIKSIQTGTEYCNVTLETLYPMPPYINPTTLVLNTKQVMLVSNAEEQKK